ELGKIRHWQFHQSRLALSDYNKARQLRLRAIALAPRDVENRKKLSNTLPNIAETYSALADREGLLRVWQDQQENDLRILELDPYDPQSFYSVSAHTEDLADTLTNIGRKEEGAAQLKVSFDLIEKAIALQQAAPVSLDGQVWLVSFSMQKAGLLHKWGRSDEALAVYQAASDLAVQTYRADNTKRFAFNHASRIHRYMGDIYAERGDWQKYLECSEFSMNWIRENRDNRNLWAGGFPPLEAFYIVRVGIALNKLGQKQAGIARVDEGLNLHYQAVRLHPNHGEDVFYAFELIEPATQFYLDTNQINKAVAIWENYIEMTEPFVAKNPDDTSSRGFLSYAFERKGDILAGYEKERETFAQTDISKLRQAQTSYQEGLRHRQQILQLDPMNQAHIEAENFLTLKISRLDARLKG
ncbi:MAG TPA: hypothetical protein VKD91_20755, partial [Pyrinomonadaceae bacterium]|nr:hypothetical protein [Pyrinomonadaceae bacterium]